MVIKHLYLSKTSEVKRLANDALSNWESGSEAQILILTTRFCQAK